VLERSRASSKRTQRVLKEHMTRRQAAAHLAGPGELAMYEQLLRGLNEYNAAYRALKRFDARGVPAPRAVWRRWRRGKLCASWLGVVAREVARRAGALLPGAGLHGASGRSSSSGESGRIGAVSGADGGIDGRGAGDGGGGGTKGGSRSEGELAGETGGRPGGGPTQAWLDLRRDWPDIMARWDQLGLSPDDYGPDGAVIDVESDEEEIQRAKSDRALLKANARQRYEAKQNMRRKLKDAEQNGSTEAAPGQTMQQPSSGLSRQREEGSGDSLDGSSGLTQFSMVPSGEQQVGLRQMRVNDQPRRYLSTSFVSSEIARRIRSAGTAGEDVLRRATTAALVAAAAAGPHHAMRDAPQGVRPAYLSSLLAEVRNRARSSFQGPQPAIQPSIPGRGVFAVPSMPFLKMYL
jgi:hypothetical protein